jgi:hypothetical protein
MFDALDCGVLFVEQVVQFKWHRHTVMDCIPLPRHVHADAPAFFKEALLASEEEWSQHKKIIDTSEKGIRRSLVKNLPYFHVWFDHNRGYGHVIEEPWEWKLWFGQEIIGKMLDLSPEKWRKPRRATLIEDADRSQWFRSRWSAYDWTRLLS